MNPDFEDIEVVVLAPKRGARAELLALRPQLIAEYRAAFGDRFGAALAEEGPERWVDVWGWADRADAERALADRRIIPSFERWEQLVDLESVTWMKRIA